MSHLTDQFEPQRDSIKRRKIQQRLNRLYWIFMFVLSVVAAYMIGWIQGYMA